MLSKKNRLKKKSDFARVFKEGKSLKENFLVLRAAKGAQGPARFGIVVSRKVSKKAVLRNKIKRRISESIRLKIKKIKKEVDVLLIAVPGLEKKEAREIEETVDKLLKRAKCLKS